LSISVSTLLNSPDKVSGRYLGLMAWNLLIAHVFYLDVEGEERLGKFIQAYLTAGAILAASGFFFYFLYMKDPESILFDTGAQTGVHLGYGFLIGRLTGLEMDPSAYAVSLMPFIFICMSELTKRVRLYKSFSLPILVILLALLANLALTFSRSGFLAFFLSFGLFQFLLWRTERSRKRKMRQVSILLVLILGASIFIWPFLSSLDLAEQFEDRASFQEGRVALWKEALQIFSRSPWVGVGPGRIHEYTQVEGLVKFQAHNSFLEVLTESGLFAAGVLGLLMAAVVAFSYRALRRMKPGPLWYDFLGLYTGFVGIIILNQAISFITNFVLWFQLGVLIAFQRAAGRLIATEGTERP